jgi:hypothetical protein
LYGSIGYDKIPLRVSYSYLAPLESWIQNTDRYRYKYKASSGWVFEDGWFGWAGERKRRGEEWKMDGRIWGGGLGDMDMIYDIWIWVACLLACLLG